MELKHVEQNTKTGISTFTLNGANPAIANALRRYVAEVVPTLAIETVEFKKNDCVLYDEIVALRLGLVPLSTDLKTYEFPKEGVDPLDSAKCHVKLTLKGKGPGYVYAGDMKSKDPAIKPVQPKIPIVKLTKGQEIELTATAILGRGKDHAKWSPGRIWYRYNMSVALDQKKVDAHKDAILADCPSGVFKVKGGKLAVDENILVVDPLAGEQVEGAADKYPGITITHSDTDFIFHVEPWGQLSVKEMVTQAITLFREDIGDFKKVILAK